MEKALKSKHICIFLPSQQSADAIVDTVLPICEAPILSPNDPLEEYLSVHYAAATTMQSGGDAFFRSAEKRVAKWGQGRKIDCRIAACDVTLVVTETWVSVIFRNETTEAEGLIVTQKIVDELGGEAVVQLYAYPSMEVLKAGIRIMEAQKNARPKHEDGDLEQ